MTTTPSGAGNPDDSSRHGLGEPGDPEEILAEIQDLADVGYWRHDLRTDEVTASDHWYELWGLDPEGEDGSPYSRFLEMVHPDDRAAVEEARETAVGKRRRVSFSFRIRRPGGEQAWIASSLVPEVEDGEVVALRGVNQDITERKEVELELEEERRRLQEAQRVAGVGSWEWDVRKDTMEFSDEKYRLLGLDPDDPEEMDLETFLHCIHPEDRGRVEENRDRAIGTGEYRTIEWRTNPERGSVRWIREEGEGVVEDGEVVLVRGTAMDVTEQKRVLEDLKSARDAAVAANEAKSQFMANTSHEIRTPMNAIVGLTALVLDTDLDEDQREHLETVEASSEHLLSIINDVLDLSQLETGKFVLDDIPFDLRSVVEESFSLIQNVAGQKDLNLAYRYGEDVPEGIRGDPQRVRQVLVNLLSNAVKFTGEGEVVLSVGLADEQPADEGSLVLVFEVRDTGKGIPEDAMETLFDPYTRAGRGLTSTAEGTGLGLSIARNLVETMGGTLEAESELDVGSTFRFTLPATPAEVELERPWKGHVEDFAGSRFLVVDDNETNREIIEETVTPWGVDVTMCSTGEEALEFLDHDKDFDLVLVDYSMPGMDGLEFADHLRSNTDLAEIPMILHTSMQRSQRDRASSVFADVLVKPVSPSDLFEATARAIHGTGPGTGPEKALDVGLGEELGITVLLAEDNPVNRKVVEKILERFGIPVEMAADGEDALEELRDRDFDLVFMDLQMPRMNGLDATKAIRSEFPPERQPRIVALTAHAAADDRERCLQAGMDGYLVKPVSPGDLEKALREAADPESQGGPEA